MDVEVREILAEMEVELKYCERCGGLWLRPVGGRQIYCPPCIPKMAHLPFSRHEADVASLLDSSEGRRRRHRGVLR